MRATHRVQPVACLSPSGGLSYTKLHMEQVRAATWEGWWLDEIGLG